MFGFQPLSLSLSLSLSLYTSTPPRLVPLQVKFWEGGDAPPVFSIDGTNYLYIRKSGLLFVCTTRYNVSPSMIIELLNRISKVIKDYCGVLSEEAIRKNFILVYELLDEILDYGYPQVS